MLTEFGSKFITNSNVRTTNILQRTTNRNLGGVSIFNDIIQKNQVVRHHIWLKSQCKTHANERSEKIYVENINFCRDVLLWYAPMVEKCRIENVYKKVNKCWQAGVSEMITKRWKKAFMANKLFNLLKMYYLCQLYTCQLGWPYIWPNFWTWWHWKMMNI